MTVPHRLAAAGVAVLALGAPAAALAQAPVLEDPGDWVRSPAAFRWAWPRDGGGAEVPAWSEGSINRGFQVRQGTSGPVVAEKNGEGVRFLQAPSLAQGGPYAFLVQARETPCIAFAANGSCTAYAPGPPEPIQTSNIVSFGVDDAPPAGTVQVDGGAAYARSRDVRLTLAATDNRSGVASVQVAGGGGYRCDDEDTCPRPFATQVSTTLPEGPDGPRTVRVVFFDGAVEPFAEFGDPGNRSAEATDGIFLDRVAPTAAAAGPATLTVRQPGDFTAAGSRDDTDGADDSGLDPAGYSWSWGDGSGTAGATASHAWAAPGTYTVTLTTRDRAGNSGTASRTVAVAAAPAASSGQSGGEAPLVVTPPPEPGGGTVAHAARLSALRAPARARAGTTITVQVRLSQAAGLTVRLHRAGRGRLGAAVRTVARRARAGVVRVPLTLPGAGTYRIVIRTEAGARVARALRVLPPRRPR